MLSRAAVLVLTVRWLIPVLDSCATSRPFEPASLPWRYRTIVAIAPTMVNQLIASEGAAVLGALLGWRWLVPIVSNAAFDPRTSTSRVVVVPEPSAQATTASARMLPTE